jgi:hypothetical protein
MPECTLEEIFKGPWGLVEHRRSEVESGHFGVFAKILEEEICRHFSTAEGVAALMEVHPSTACRWLRRYDPRYIVRDGAHWYHLEDVARIIQSRKESKTQPSKEKHHA